MKMKVPVLILLVLNLSICISAYKFLLVYHTAGRSLNILGEEFMKHLLHAGHEVTFITNFPTKMKNERLREIDISSNYESFKEIDVLKINYVMENKLSNDPSLIRLLTIQGALAVFNHKNVRQLIEDPKERFDAVIADLNECELYAALSVLYNCPLIWAYSMGPHWHVLTLIDGATNPAYNTYYLSSSVPPLSFSQRVEGLWHQFKWLFNRWWTYMPLESYHYEQIFAPLLEKRGRTLPPYRDIVYNASLTFSNTIEAFGNVPATPANFKMIGGYHIDPVPKPLSENLKAIMDNSTYGFIYFSMGSMWHAKFLPNSVKNSLIEMFGKLKETVIWKYEEDLPNLPGNVHILKWAPQTSILSHPKCLIFITHGGLLSSTEAVHFGVPIIGVPIYFDQFLNVNTAVEKGYALRVELTYDLAENLKTAINTMLGDQKYKQKIQQLSKIYHDRPLSPGKELVHWSEHVVRTGGAPHLRSPALHVPMYQKLYLDLAALVLGTLLTIYFTTKTLLKTLGIFKKNNNEDTALEKNSDLKKKK